MEIKYPYKQIRPFYCSASVNLHKCTMMKMMANKYFVLIIYSFNVLWQVLLFLCRKSNTWPFEPLIDGLSITGIGQCVTV